MRSRRSTALAAAALLAVLVSARAFAQRVSIQLRSNDVYAGLPFELNVTAEGFDEEPTPDAPSLEIENCKVTPLGVSPNVSSFTQIINGRRYEERRVTFVYRYRVIADEPGRYRAPAVTIVQGQKSATSPGGTFTVAEVESTRDMRLELELPDRAVYVGETFEVTLDWYLRKDPSEPSFVIPLFDLETAEVEAPEVVDRNHLVFAAGTQDLRLPYVRDQVLVGGTQYTRFRFRVFVTVNRPGAIELEPPRVAASLATGTTRDRFGFRRKRTQLFKAEGKRQRLSVRALPQQGRPASFVNAIGSGFSLTTQASRTVVQVGDPIELVLEVRGDGRLEGLSLPPLDVEGGLSPAHFSIPDERVAGEIDQERNAKTFLVTVRLKSTAAAEIPALPFSFFDPTTGQYRTVHSEPIALSVRHGTVVGAADVVGARPDETIGSIPGATINTASTGFLRGSLVGADLSLSGAERTLRRARSLDDIKLYLVALYALPIAIMVFRLWHIRTESERGRSSNLKTAITTAEQAVAAARKQPARDAAPALLTALRGLRDLAGGAAANDGSTTLERIETEAFNPQAADQPVASTLLDEASELARRWGRSARESNGRTPQTATLLLVLLLTSVVGVAVDAAAADAPEHDLGVAREVYGKALEENDRVRRTRGFAEAESVLRQLAAANPSSPELLVDWGNAALGAQDMGRATLAYRRALRLDPTHERALKNLSWVRDRAPRWLPQPSKRSAVDTLFFWHHSLSLATRHLIAAVAFAVAILLLAPWRANLRASLRRLAFVPIVVWLAMLASAFVEPDPEAAAVVVGEGFSLRSADSDGAPAALSSPLPAGAEVTVLEPRDGWTRVGLADGTRGWLKSHAIERVVRR